jgi:hypothetical protein
MQLPGCSLQDSADFPSVMNSMVAFMRRRIQKLSDNGAITSIMKNRNLGRRLFPIEKIHNVNFLAKSHSTLSSLDSALLPVFSQAEGRKSCVISERPCIVGGLQLPFQSG